MPRRLLEAALQCATAEEVAALLEKPAFTRSAPLLDPELVLTDIEAATKAEAIKVAVDRLYALGRTDDPCAVEEAVWQREATYSTGFGHGFAVPHCKTNAVQANSLVLLKLRTPLAWGSLDGGPVRVMVLLVMRATDGGTKHMKVFAQLARQMMHEDFRGRLEKGKTTRRRWVRIPADLHCQSKYLTTRQTNPTDFNRDNDYENDDTNNGLAWHRGGSYCLGGRRGGGG